MQATGITTKIAPTTINGKKSSIQTILKKVLFVNIFRGYTWLVFLKVLLAEVDKILKTVKYISQELSGRDKS